MRQVEVGDRALTAKKQVILKVVMERHVFEEFDEEIQKTSKGTTEKRTEASAGYFTKGDSQRIPTSQYRFNKEKNIEKYK